VLGWSAALAAALVAAAVLWYARHEEPAVEATPATAVPEPTPAPQPALAAPVAPAAEPAASAATAPAGPAAPPPDGRVMLAIAPWGEVLVNGQSRGVSPPLTTMNLAPGSYSIEIRNGDLPPLRASIEVKPGQTQTLSHRF
jgi:hypothetical protein